MFTAGSNGANDKSEKERFYALRAAAKESFGRGEVDKAREYARELLALAPKFKSNWNYGNAIQDGNMILGRVAAAAGNVEEAKQYLLLAGSSPGSPQLNSFGPNMSLAKDLIETGERDVVLRYFELCAQFWKLHESKIAHWSECVKAGRVPHFGANLLY